MTAAGGRRAEILAAAAEVFVERGYDATTTRDIGDRAGLLSGSLYHHFDAKEQMLYELVRDVYAATPAYAATVDAAGGSAATRLARLLTEHVRHLLSNRSQAALFLHEFRSLTPEHQAEIEAAERQYVDGLTDLVVEGQADGSLRSDVDPRLARMVVLGAANWAYRWWTEQGAWTVDDVAQAVVAIVVHGLTAGDRVPVAAFPHDRTGR